jgi:hypothetical protein
MKRIQGLLAAAFSFLCLLTLLAGEECTTVVVAGKATVDGRPLLWKNRDTDDVHNEAVYITGGVYPVVGIVNAGSTTSTWMGINSAGLAIENSLSSDLDGPSSGENGSFMKLVLQTCASVAEFEQLLLETNFTGRATQANYGVIDATGAAAIFETGNHIFTKYDANDSATAPAGFVVRTNFAFTGDGSGTGYERYFRAVDLVASGISRGLMSYEYLLRNVARDLRNDQIDPYPLPYLGSQEGHPAGYIRTDYSINRHRTRSCAVFHGVRPDEDPRLSTMWVILGEPVCGVAAPLWVHAGATPPEMNGTVTAPLSDAVFEKKSDCYTDSSSLPHADQYLDTYALIDGLGGGILTYSFPIEGWIFARAEEALSSWRVSFPTSNVVSDIQEDIVYQAYCFFLTSTAPTEIPAPANLAGRRVLNRSLFLAEHIDVLTWSPRPGSGDISRYRIYTLEDGKKVLLGEVDSLTNHFWRRNVQQTGRYQYAVAAVDAEEHEGNPACISIGGASQPSGGSQTKGITSVRNITRQLTRGDAGAAEVGEMIRYRLVIRFPAPAF